LPEGNLRRALSGEQIGTLSPMSEELAQLVLEDARDKMDKAVDTRRTEFSHVRTGRANSALLETLMVRLSTDPDPACANWAGFSVPDAMLLSSPL